MKLKNSVTDRITEKCKTFFSSIVTKVRMTRASSRDYLKENRRDVFLALVILVSLFIVPLVFCVTASASEVSEPVTQELNTLPDGVLVDEVPFFPDSPPYPSVYVKTGVGAYSTPKGTDVYAYLTSYNNPRASTRSATIDTTTGALRSRTFVFKNASNASATADMTYNIDCLQYLPLSYDDADRLILDPRLKVRLRLSADTSVTVRCTVAYPAPLDSTSFVQEWTEHITPNGWFDYASTLPMLEFYLSSDSRYSSYVLTKVEVIVHPLDFDNVSPDTSYVDVYAFETDVFMYNDYLQNISNFVNLRDLNIDLAYDYGLEMGEYYGREQGFIEGYDDGYQEGYVNGKNAGESSQFNPGWFVQAVDSFLNIRLFEYEYAGIPTAFTLGTIFSIAVGGTALLWFIKIFAGG